MPAHMPTTLWRQGQSGNPGGRPRGSRNALSEEVISALLRDFKKHGEKAVAQARRDNPGMWLKVIAMLIPREHKVQNINPIKDLTDQELETIIEHIETLLEAQAGRSVKLIGGTYGRRSYGATRDRASQAKEPADAPGGQRDRAAGAQAEEARAVAR